MSIQQFDVDVVVVGCGPVGALTANLLGARGVNTLVVERGTEPHGQPRAFSADDEALRIYQQAGLVDALLPDLFPSPRAEYVNAKGRQFAEVALSEVDFGFGYAPLYFFDQPRLEATLRAGLHRFDHVTLWPGVELVGMQSDSDGVTLSVTDSTSGRTRPVRARYVLGCDGARSTTRALAGIGLVGSSSAEPWLAVSGDAAPEAVKVNHTRFVCDWRRPAFVSPGTHGTYRMEFMLRTGEQAEVIERPEHITALASPYVDPAQFVVRRAAVYTFHNLVANRWRADRVFLLGDAAHQMPPFMGQGLCSGLRDAANLAWKLAMVVNGEAAPDLLDTYEVERRPHAEAMARTSVQMGRVFLARTRSSAFLRDVVLRAVQTLPRVRRFLRHFEFKPVPAHERGLMATGRRRGGDGVMFPQPQVRLAGSALPQPLDDVLGSGFAVIGSAVSPELADDPAWCGLPLRLIRVREDGEPAPSSGGVVEVDDPGGVLTGWLRRHRAELAVLRPDRFVFGTGRRADVGRLAARLTAQLGWASTPPPRGLNTGRAQSPTDAGTADRSDKGEPPMPINPPARPDTRAAW